MDNMLCNAMHMQCICNVYALREMRVLFCGNSVFGDYSEEGEGEEEGRGVREVG